jgi:hypothetical protein
MYRLFLAIAILGASIYATGASAGCSCGCYDGKAMPICSNSYDIPPICPATICTRPSITPIPPIGSRSSSCREVQVCDAFQRCVWKNPCDKH